MAMEGPQMRQSGQEPIETGQLKLDLRPMITETEKPFDLFSGQELEDFKKAIAEGRVALELVGRFRTWEEEEREADRLDKNPPGPGWGR